MKLIQKILYKRKKWYVKRNRYKRKYRMSFREIKVLWDKINNTQYNNDEYYYGLRSVSDILTQILISSQKSFRIYYFDDNDVFDMIKIVETVRNRDVLRKTFTGGMICFKFISDLRITNSELYLKYRLLL